MCLVKVVLWLDVASNASNRSADILHGTSALSSNAMYVLCVVCVVYGDISFEACTRLQARNYSRCTASPPLITVDLQNKQ